MQKFWSSTESPSTMQKIKQRSLLSGSQKGQGDLSKRSQCVSGVGFNRGGAQIAHQFNRSDQEVLHRTQRQ